MGNLITFWNIKTRSKIQIVDNLNSVNILKFTPDKLMISPSGESIKFFNISNFLFNVSLEFEFIDVHANTVKSIELIGNDTLESSGNDNIIKIWDLTTKNKISIVQM